MPAIVDLASPEHLLLTVSGQITLEEIEEATAELRPHYASGRPLLVDAREVENAFSVRELVHLTRDLRQDAARGLHRIAIATRHAEARDASRTLAGFTATVGIDMRVFDSLEEAARWFSEASLESARHPAT